MLTYRRRSSRATIFFCDSCARIFIACVPNLPLRAQVLVDVIQQPVKLPLRLLETRLQFRIGIAHLLRHAHFFQLHVQIECLFQQVRRHARWILLVLATLPRMLFADLGAVQLQQIFRTADWIPQRAISIVQQRGIRQAPLLFILLRACKAIRMQLAAQLMKLVFQHAEIEIQLRHKSEDRKIIPSRRRLNLAAMRTK